MATKEDIMQAMRKMAAKTEDPKMMKHFKGYNKTLLMSFSDIGLDVTMVFQDGHGSATEGTPENPDMTVVTDSMTILGVLNGTISGSIAAMEGRIKPKGPVRDLLKLQRLLSA